VGGGIYAHDVELFHSRISGNNGGGISNWKPENGVADT
jgi:hypothetical protein